MFFDTTSIYFEGESGQSLGERGHSKDHRPDLRQMVVGLAVDVQGRPICCELWPGNTADVTALKPVVERMRQRFRLREVTDNSVFQTVEDQPKALRVVIAGAGDGGLQDYPRIATAADLRRRSISK